MLMFSLLSKFIPKAYAQVNCKAGLTGGFDLGDCLKLSDSTPVKDVYTNPAFLVNLIVSNIFIGAGIFLFFVILLAGIKFLTQDKKGVEEAKTMVTTAIIGFVIMFSAYWIVQIVALVTGADILL